MTKSIYDIEMNSWDNKPGFLNKYKGKVSLVINVTGDCGNAPEYGVIEKLYQDHKDKGFEVIAIPTNQYCGEGITYGKYVEGITCANDAREHGQEVYGVTYDFSEMVNSKPGPVPSKEFLEKLYPGREKEFPLQLAEGEVPHELYQEISRQIVEINSTMPDNNHRQGENMFGNFEKYLIDKDGYVVKYYHNGALMPFISDNNSLEGTGIYVGPVDEEYARISQDIELLLSA